MAKGGSWGEVQGLLLKIYGESKPKASNPTTGGCLSALQSLSSPLGRLLGSGGCGGASPGPACRLHPWGDRTGVTGGLGEVGLLPTFPQRIVFLQALQGK